MSPKSHKTIIIATITLLSLLSFFVEGDDQLIDSLCKATELPSSCYTCVKSKSGIDVTDTSIVTSMLTCAQDDANKVHFEIIRTIDEGFTQGNLTTALRTCSGLVVGIIANSRPLKQLVSNAKYDLAKSSIEGPVYYNIDQCNKVANQTNVTIPSPIFVGLSKLKIDYKLSLQLIKAVSTPV
ncbi:hypothetical protein RND81_10G239900 [Saponaria officinalis]|uniref:Pectinesterase inhibitor domain-containing protein n=1 Tax=Saponaria officinalis TaxID=3572 RepID=A0AAW1I7Y2_SAPOF